MTEISSAARSPTIEPPSTTPGGRVGEDLDEPPGVAVDEGPGVGGEGHLGHPDLATQGEGLGLGQAHVGDLGLGEDGAGRLVVVEVAVLAGVEPHDVLGHLAPLGGCDRRQRQLPGQVAGGVDVAHVRLAVLVHRHVATVVDLDAGFGEPEPLGVRDGADGEQGVRSVDHAPVVALDDHAVVLDRHTGRRAPLYRTTPVLRKSASRAAATSGSLPGSTCWRLTMRLTFAPERPEHVDELDAGHPRADHDQVLGHLGRRIGLPGDQDPPAIHLRPVRHPRAAAGRQQHGVGVQLQDPALGRLDDHLAGALERPRRPRTTRTS